VLRAAGIDAEHRGKLPAVPRGVAQQEYDRQREECRHLASWLPRGAVELRRDGEHLVREMLDYDRVFDICFRGLLRLRLGVAGLPGHLQHAEIKEQILRALRRYGIRSLRLYVPPVSPGLNP
jgi:hypothetical protein